VAGERPLDGCGDHRERVLEGEFEHPHEGAVAVGQVGAQALAELLEGRWQVALAERRRERDRSGLPRQDGQVMPPVADAPVLLVAARMLCDECRFLIEADRRHVGFAGERLMGVGGGDAVAIRGKRRLRRLRRPDRDPPRAVEGLRRQRIEGRPFLRPARGHARVGTGARRVPLAPAAPRQIGIQRGEVAHLGHRRQVAPPDGADQVLHRPLLPA